MTHRLAIWLAAALSALTLGASFSACPKPIPDVDDAPHKPGVRTLGPEDEAQGRLELAARDRVDWLALRPEASGDGLVSVTIGDPFAAPHQLHGRAELFSDDARPLASAAIGPQAQALTLAWPAVAHERVLLKLEASSGAAPYRVSFSVTRDPCQALLCPSGEVCAEGRCVPAPCPGGCGEGLACQHGVCVRLCGGCPRDYCCDADAGVCHRDPCPSGRCAISRPCR